MQPDVARAVSDAANPSQPNQSKPATKKTHAAAGDTMTKSTSLPKAPSVDAAEASCLEKKQSTLTHISRRVMRDFHGLESSDAPTREAILNFSYFLAQGEMDAAFKSMKLIRATTVWQASNYLLTMLSRHFEVEVYSAR